MKCAHTCLIYKYVENFFTDYIGITKYTLIIWKYILKKVLPVSNTKWSRVLFYWEKRNLILLIFSAQYLHMVWKRLEVCKKEHFVEWNTWPITKMVNQKV